MAARQKFVVGVLSGGVGVGVGGGAHVLEYVVCERGGRWSSMPIRGVAGFSSDSRPTVIIQY